MDVRLTRPVKINKMNRNSCCKLQQFCYKTKKNNSNIGFESDDIVISLYSLQTVRTFIWNFTYTECNNALDHSNRPILAGQPAPFILFGC